jgi:hypothetical protein
MADFVFLLGKTTNPLELAEIECENRGHDGKPFVLEVSRQITSGYQGSWAGG